MTSTTDQAVGTLVAERPARARLFEQLGIDYCCGGRRPLADVCRERGLDAATVAVLLDAAGDERGLVESDWGRASLQDLCDHIVHVHHAFLRRELPRLSGLLARCERAHADEHPALTEVRETFERLRLELEHHLVEEERTLFPACRRLAAGETGSPLPGGAFERFEDEHAATGALLQRLSTLTRGYDVADALCNTHRAAMDGLAELDHDLREHIHEENNILFPRALAMTEP